MEKETLHILLDLIFDLCITKTQRRLLLADASDLRRLFLPFQPSDWCRVQRRENRQIRVEVVQFSQVLRKRRTNQMKSLGSVMFSMCSCATYLHDLYKFEKQLLPVLSFLLLHYYRAHPSGQEDAQI